MEAILFLFFECPIVNLATYRQFTIGCLRLNVEKSKFPFLEQKM